MRVAAMTQLQPVRPAAPRAARRRQRRGMGLVELLIALSISAALLTATAVAVDASFYAYGVNQSQTVLAHRARVAMHRIVTYIRSTSEHRPDNDDPIDDFEAGIVCNDSAIRMLLTDTSGVIFRQQGTQLLMVPFNIVGGALVEGAPNVMLNGVNPGDFTITFEPQRSAEQIRTGQPEYDQLKRASIRLTLRPDNQLAGDDRNAQPVTISTSVMPRKNFW
jgi:prepilin-type N-terminal cleavage/methylation domain-containing protein